MEPKDEYTRKATAHRRGGAGTHADKRTKRARTRGARDARVIREQRDAA